ncbi:MAG: hypothetical protein ACOCX2_15380 [Armatimonadota bacterium]
MRATPGDERHTTRGRLLHTFQPNGRGTAVGAIIAMFGLFMSVPALQMLDGGAPHDLRDLPLPVGILLVSTVPFFGGIALAVRSLRERVLVFESGFVLRDWRGRERFVPWERLRTLEVQSGMTGATGTLVAWIDPEESGARPEKLTLGTATEVGDPEEVDSPGIAAELAKHADLHAGPRGWRSWSGQVWQRKNLDER